MKKCILPAGILVALLVTSSFAAQKKADTATIPEMVYYVVQVTFHNCAVSNIVMNSEQTNAIAKDVVAEAGVFKEALQLAEKDWKAHPATKDKSWPKSAISQKKMKIVGNKYTDEIKAMEKATAITDKAADKEKEKQKKIDDNDKTLKTPESQIKARAKKATEEEAHNNLARKFFETRLKELLGAAVPDAVSTNKPADKAQSPATEQKPKEEKKK